MVICLERGADLHMAQQILLPLTVSCFSKIQIGFTFLVLAHPGGPGQRAVKRVCVCVCVCLTRNSLYYIICQDLPFVLDFELFLSTTTTVLWPVYRSTCVSWHLKLRTGGFCSCKVFLPTCRCWWQPVQASLLVREETLEFSSTLSPYHFLL